MTNEFVTDEEKRLKKICNVVDQYVQKRREKISEHASKMREIENDRFKEQSVRQKDRYTRELRDLSLHDPSKFTPSFDHPSVPYLLGLVISDDNPKIGRRHYLFGKQGLSNPITHEQVVIDWRQASISALYYDWDEGEEYDDEINGFERTGTIEKKIAYGIKNRELLSLETASMSLQKEDGSWLDKKGDNVANAKKKQSEDHRLVDIVSLISKEQFSLITNRHEGCFYLTGGAGSGKTTVALHRLSYLAYNHPEKIRPKKCLVVMFNRSLREYVNQTSKDLIDKDVAVETIYSWATKALQSLGVQAKFSVSEDQGVGSIKKSLKMYNALLEYAYVSEAHPDGSVADLGKFYRSQEILTSYIRKSKNLTRIMESGQQILNEPNITLSYNDIGLLLCLAGLRKNGNTVDGAINHYDHIIVDEAQDLSLAELRCLSMATNSNKSMTICADKKQKILDFVDSESFDVFQADLERQNLMSGALGVSFRSTKQIMKLASQVSGEPLPEAPNEGPPPKFHKFSTQNECLESLRQGVQYVAKSDPKGLYAVICRFKKDAVLVHKKLKGIPNVRLQSNIPDFRPGVIVVNAHQVKGLEFSGVFLWNPDKKSYPKTRSAKNLLYVAITRASEKLAVYSFEPVSELLKDAK